VLPNKSLAHMARGILDSADNTHLSRFLSEAPWREDAIHHRRIRFMRHQTNPHRRRRCESVVVIDDTLCEHVGSLFDDVDRHDNHSDGTYPLAHNPVTSCSVSGPVRVPLDLRRYRRDEELTQWEAAVAQHFPDVKIPTDQKARHRLHQQVDPVWLQDPEFRARHEQCRTNIALAIELREEAIRHKVPLGVVVCDAWYLAEDLIQVLARRRKDWISLRKTNRLLETASFLLRDANGWTLKLPGPHIAVEELVPLIPANAYRPVTVGEHTYGCFTLAVRIPRLGKVRLVVSFAQESLTGRYLVLVTNRPDWSAAKIISLYAQRWPTETFDRDGKGHLGFNESRMRSAEAMGTHGCLVFVAYSLLHLTCLPAGPGRTRGLIHTMGDACRPQGRALLQKLVVFVHDQLSQGAPIDQVFAQVCVKPQGMVLV
jgi:DDE superfamily endonuclease